MNLELNDLQTEALMRELSNIVQNGDPSDDAGARA